MATQGELEAAISAGVCQFERDYMGRGPEETKAYVVDDMILVRLRGVLTPAEKQLARADATGSGRTLIKQVRAELIEKARPMLEAILADVTKRKVRSLHTDISTVTGERVILFTLDGPPEHD